MCPFCESALCDTDCYACAKMNAFVRPTALELRASYRAALEKIVAWDGDPSDVNAADDLQRIARRALRSTP